MKDYRELLARPYAGRLVERFLTYVRMHTTSDRHAEGTPSTPGQWDLARHLLAELNALPSVKAELDDLCYLVGRLPASPGMEGVPAIGLMAHMDTASDVPGFGVKPRVIADYDGSPVPLSPGMTLDPADYPDLAEHAGDSIVVGDGSTLLGADDKAGVAEIMTAVEFLCTHPEILHGPVEVIFTPDEETGKGMNRFPLSRIESRACYTLDGGKAPEIEAECFSAWAVRAEFTGKVIHIGSARGKLANAVAMAADFVSSLPRSESPESTDGWYGYYCPLEIQGSLEKAVVEVYLRDFTDEGMRTRLESVRTWAKAVEARHPLGSVRLEERKQYLNMRKKLDETPRVLEKLLEAVRRTGAEPVMKPIRGGTDGARLTEMGIPTPNIFTGGYNYHSRHEWASVAGMAQAVDTIVELVQLWTE